MSKISEYENSFYPLLRVELKEKFEKFVFEGDKEKAFGQFNKIVSRKVDELETKFKVKPKEIKKCLISEKHFIQYFELCLAPDPNLTETQIEKKRKEWTQINQINGMLNFIHNTNKRINKMSLDYYSMCIGYEGYLDFCRRNEQNKKQAKEKIIGETILAPTILKEVIHETSNPIDDDIELETFFEHPCYLYAYDEDLAEVNEETEPLSYHFPNIDALVLCYYTKTKKFTLKNVGQKADHCEGEIKWCREGKEEREDYNSFDIIFGESRTKLILRLHIPKINKNEDHEFNLMLGAFLLAKKEGALAIGSVVLHKVGEKEEGKEIKPDKYKFKTKFGERNTIEIPEEILVYLFDRYKNWLKIPDKQYNLEKFKKWVDKKKGKNYTDNKITIYDYLITHPKSALVDNDRIKIVDEIEEIFKDPAESLKNESALTDNNKKYLGEYMRLKYERNEFVIYPDNSKHRESYEGINWEFFQKLTQTLNVVLIIPNPENEYIRVSSIFTVIGYCIALKKRTFVFFEKGFKRPNILELPEKEVNLHIQEYERLSEIPKLLVNNKFRGTWEQNVADYLGINVEDID